MSENRQRSSDDNNDRSNFKQKKKFNKNNFNNQKRVQSQMETKLSALYNKSITVDGRFPDINTLVGDGVDHINVYNRGETKLGFLLHPSAPLGFTVFDKPFNSIDNLMLYYRTYCTCESIRTIERVTNFHRKDISRYPRFENLYAIVVVGYAQVFKAHPELLEALNNNTLALDSYIVRSKKEGDKSPGKEIKDRLSSAGILLKAIKEAQSAFNENREVRLSRFIHHDVLVDCEENAKAKGTSVNTEILNLFIPSFVSANFIEDNPNFGISNFEEPVESVEQPAGEIMQELGDVNTDPDLSKCEAAADSAPSLPGDTIIPTGQAVINAEDGTVIKYNTLTLDEYAVSANACENDDQNQSASEQVT